MNRLKIIYALLVLVLCSFTNASHRGKFVKIKTFNIHTSSHVETYSFIKGYKYMITSNDDDNIKISLFEQASEKLNLIKKGKSIIFKPKKTTIYHVCFELQDNKCYDKSKEYLGFFHFKVNKE